MINAIVRQLRNVNTNNTFRTELKEMIKTMVKGACFVRGSIKEVKDEGVFGVCIAESEHWLTFKIPGKRPYRVRREMVEITDTIDPENPAPDMTTLLTKTLIEHESQKAGAATA